MNSVRFILTLLVFGIITYLVLNGLLAVPWNWSLVGHLAIAFLASIVAIFIGSLVAGVVTLLPMRGAKHESFSN